MSTRLKALGIAALRIAPSAIQEACGLAGGLVALHGVEMIYPPAAWILGGVAVMTYAFLAARARVRKTS